MGRNKRTMHKNVKPNLEQQKTRRGIHRVLKLTNVIKHHMKRFLVNIGTTLRQVIRVTTNSQIINHATRGKQVV